ncbi:Stk1 family PASTA domain-containing Ser/Thr kinase [Aerococcus kribbianus]|uniref:non-specific serine/threonine protein kinase n=1 Tax=Aerococcus kribbianus TaxID=2999064 RepID=A0A9X3FPI0_9LACT|nr:MULTISPECIES: Stk1 family PASTA domain-containing Ser/Thr kinase [unclassified Aerococcus]MCZ0717196.1 Stk1 family PASTA domain-containing Ser/Thr kinase [Aerococcus sp. YH-aer221]MCZ0725484.1 Stk1 family PASTA domain-containing Ser/Thr kinase [Aerococcus sp. YH-aer222]
MKSGQIIDERYEIIRLIGSGGMANVYLAYDPILERDVAIKFLRLGDNNQSDAVRRFEREALSISELNDPNIVAVYDIGEDTHGKFIVMEYVDGVDLKEYIRENHPIPLHKIQNIMLQIVSGMQSAHELNIIHRDLKPQNIMIKDDGTVIIMDFGIAVVSTETSITQTNTIIGSVHYLSPEQARGSLATSQSDIYSLGIVLFEMITGRVPFDAESAVSIALKHFQDPLPDMEQYREDVNQPLMNVVKRATAKEASDRYESCQEMYDDLATIFAEDRQSEPDFVPMGAQSDTIVVAKDQIEQKMRYTDEHQAMAAGKDDDLSDNLEDADSVATQTTPIPVVAAADNDQSPEDKVEQASHKGVKVGPTAAQKKQRRKRLLMILLPIFLLLAIVSAVVFGRGQQIDVPDLAGMTVKEAERVLQEEDLTLGEVEEVFSEDVGAGFVVGTNPEANHSVRKESKIDLEVSKGPELFKVEDYTNQAYADVEKSLRDAGFTVEQSRDYSDNIAAGHIISQDIAAGEEVVAKDTTITLTVSEGVQQFTMPDLRGMNRSGVQQWADSYGVQVSFSEESSDSAPAGTAISQSIAPGDSFVMGDSLSVVMSTGPATTSFDKEITIPYEENKSEASSSSSDEGDGDENSDEDSSSSRESSRSRQTPNEIEVYIQDEVNDYSTPVDTFTISKDRKYTLNFTVRKGDSARYKIVRDGEVIQETQVSE